MYKSGYFNFLLELVYGVNLLKVAAHFAFIGMTHLHSEMANEAMCLDI